jgi:hypothetical protein
MCASRPFAWTEELSTAMRLCFAGKLAPHIEQIALTVPEPSSHEGAVNSDAIDEPPTGELLEHDASGPQVSHFRLNVVHHPAALVVISRRFADTGEDQDARSVGVVEPDVTVDLPLGRKAQDIDVESLGALRIIGW